MDAARRLQFGSPDSGRDYADRPVAFGVVLDEGRIACVEVARAGGRDHDLPGGALDPGETPAQALVREFGEETGLKVRPGEIFAYASQYVLKPNGQAVNNLAAFFVAERVGDDPALKIEPDQTLVWLTPEEAIRALRYDYHAWAVTAFLRRLQP
jgi:8-oxo-dGTP diphosphatase